jgi:NADH dehydrogenase
MQEGCYAVDVIVRRVQGLPPPLPFHYVDRGTMATIGRSAAVAQTGWFKISGFPAWLAWLFVHIIFLIEFQNRILVLWQWAWNYFTRNRSARLITGTDAELKINERSK